MTIEQLTKVDAVAIDRHGNVVLTISDHLSWDDVDGHLFSLQEKINTYLSGIESGELYVTCPEAAGRSVIISLLLKFPAPASAQWFFTKVTRAIDAAGYGFEIHSVASESVPK